VTLPPWQEGIADCVQRLVAPAASPLLMSTREGTRMKGIVLAGGAGRGLAAFLENRLNSARRVASVQIARRSPARTSCQCPRRAGVALPRQVVADVVGVMLVPEAGAAVPRTVSNRNTFPVSPTCLRELVDDPC